MTSLVPYHLAFSSSPIRRRTLRSSRIEPTELSELEPYYVCLACETHKGCPRTFYSVRDRRDHWRRQEEAHREEHFRAREKCFHKYESFLRHDDEDKND